MWLEVEVVDASGATLFHSGGYDATSATRQDDPLLRTYEVRMAAKGAEGFHFILQDQLLQDNRIPPRGFVPADDTKPVGRDYPLIASNADGGSILANWDDAPYELMLPEGLSRNLAVHATLWYQTTSRDYIQFQRDENRSDDHGAHMLALWQKYQQAPPFAMVTQTGSIEVPGVDAGDAGDGDGDIDGSGASDIGPEPIDLEPLPDGGSGEVGSGKEGVEGGCSCEAAGAHERGGSWWLWSGCLALLAIGRGGVWPRRRTSG
jgi:hypothetical protein